MKMFKCHIPAWSYIQSQELKLYNTHFIKSTALCSFMWHSVKYSHREDPGEAQGNAVNCSRVLEKASTHATQSLMTKKAMWSSGARSLEHDERLGIASPEDNISLRHRSLWIYQSSQTENKNINAISRILTFHIREMRTLVWFCDPCIFLNCRILLWEFLSDEVLSVTGGNWL